MTEELLNQLRGQLLTPKQTAKALGRSVRSLERWRCEGVVGLKPIKFGGRYRYLREDVIAFLSSREAKHDRTRQKPLDAPLQSGKTARCYHGGSDLDADTRKTTEILLNMIWRLREKQERLSKRLEQIERKDMGRHKHVTVRLGSTRRSR